MVVSFRPPFPTKFFCLFVSFERKIHRTISPTTLGHWICQNTLTTVFNMSRITLKVLTFRVIVKEVLFKVLPQIQRRQWRKKWNLFISYGGNFRRHFCSPFARSPRACHTSCTICAKNSTVGYFDGTNPITGNDIQLRSPTPIMAPGVYHKVTSVKVIFFLQVRTLKCRLHAFMLWEKQW